MRRLSLFVALLLMPSSVFAQATFQIPAGSLMPPVVVFPGSASQVLAVDGTAAAPSMAFAADPGTGFRRSAANTVTFDGAGSDLMIFGNNATGITLHAGSPLQWGSTAVNTPDTMLTRAGVAAVKVSNTTATSTAELQVSGGSGGFISSVKALTELTTIAAAATTATAIQIPANAVVLAVSVRVVTIIPTAATFTVTSATPAKTWNTAAVTVAAGSTDPGTAPGPTFQTTASAITITPNLTPGTATGQVRVTIFYYQVTPPTS